MGKSDLFFLFFLSPLVIVGLVIVWMYPWVTRLRLYSLIPYSIFGGLAIDLYARLRSHHQVEGLSGSKYVDVSIGINGVVVSTITVSVLISLLKLGPGDSCSSLDLHCRNCSEKSWRNSVWQFAYGSRQMFLLSFDRPGNTGMPCNCGCLQLQVLATRY